MPSLRKLPLLAAVASSILGAVADSTAQRPLQGTDNDDDDTPLPVVVWHGLGDSYDNEGLQSVGALVEKVHPGTFVHFVQLGASGSADRTATFYGNVTEQVSSVCDEIASHPILSTAPALDAVGFSQGGQFLRAYAERCSTPPLRSFLTFGSQHNGIVDYRTCGAADFLCKGAMALLHGNTWGSWVQSRLVPAQYFRDPADLDSYLEYSNFLADINNERVLKNETYAENLAKLDNLVMYMFEDDTTVIPKETGWFEEVNGTESTPLRARQIYKEDWIGLRTLDRKGGLKFRTTPGEHMQISDKVLEGAFEEFFGPAGKTFARDSPEIEEL
ncbi:palmitoyl-protein thioesterase 1 [Xylariomycetidae sp. FL0641]|nr:palmitoyl-protein thioesterase 1 [Xylariomycetidae sp. FL0641]